MTILRQSSWILLAALILGCLAGGKLAPAHYEEQFRDAPNAPPSRRFFLGTDELGRDRFSRLLYGARISLLLAPVAAMLSMLLAGTIGTVAAYLGGPWERSILAGIDLFLSLPWFFLLITVRATLPLDISPIISVAVTFTLLGLLGWAASARVVCAGVRTLRTSDFITNARAEGCAAWRIVVIHLAPNLKPILWAQFLVSVPAFILAEANLTMLGLGVAEPVPSLGSLLRELENYSGALGQPWRLAPLIVLMIVMWCFQILLSQDEVIA